MSMHARPFTPFSRTPHWTMAGLILIMLFIGICMVASPTRYHTLVSIHWPLGMLILALVAIRLEVVPTEAGAHTLALDRKRNKIYAFLPHSHRAAVFVDTA
jgi:cytochrome b561